MSVSKFVTEKVVRGGKDCSWFVKVGDKVVGRVDKFRNTRREDHPWKVFRCVEQSLSGPLRFQLIAMVYPQGRRLKEASPIQAATLIGSRSKAMKIAAYGMA